MHKNWVTAFGNYNPWRMAVCLHLYLQLLYLNPQLRYNYFQFWRLPCWNSTSSVDSGLIIVSCMWFCIRQLNFIQTETPSTELWRHVSFHSVPKSTLSFRFDDDTHLRRLKTIRRSNLSQISRSSAEIVLLPVSQNKWPSYGNFISYSDLTCYYHRLQVILHRCTEFHLNWTIGGHQPSCCCSSTLHPLTLSVTQFSDCAKNESTKLSSAILV